MTRGVYIAFIMMVSSCMFLSCSKDNGKGTFIYRGEYHYYSALHNSPELIETHIDTTIKVTVNKTQDSVFFSSIYFNGAFAKNSDGVYSVGHNGDLQRWEYTLTNDSLKYYYGYHAGYGSDLATGYFYGRVQ